MNRRMTQRAEKSSGLEEELLRARSILSTSRKREAIMSSPQRTVLPGSPSRSEASSSAAAVDAGNALNERMKRNMQKTKIALAKKSAELVAVTTRNRLASKRKSRTLMEVSTCCFVDYVRICEAMCQKPRCLA